MKKISKPANFRDLGGLGTIKGGRVKEKKILRSGELVHMPEADKEMLVKEYSLTTIVDFRTKEEQLRGPNDILPGVTYYTVDILGNAPGQNASLEDFINSQSEEAVDTMMQQVYEQMVLDEQAREGYRKFLHLVAGQGEGSLLFHCFAGKDRTGVGAAILLSLLEVKREEIIHDYLQTNTMRKKENEMLIKQAVKEGLPEKAIPALNAALSVKEEYLQHAFQKAEERYGSMEEYLKKGIGITDETIAQIRENCLQ